MREGRTMNGRVEGKRVLVTGAARGMGRSHAVRLAEEGADLILIDLCESIPELEYPLSSPADLEETVELVRKQGGRVVARVVDVRDGDAMRDAVAEGVAELGGLEASVATGMMPLSLGDLIAARPDLGPIYVNALP